MANKSARDTVTLKAIVYDRVPEDGDLDIGEVAKYTDAKGKVRYYVGTAEGGVSKAQKSVNAAAKTVSSVWKRVENAQKYQLDLSHKIELSELEQSLKSQGLDKKTIKGILAQESAANKAEMNALGGLLGADGLQYTMRDANNNISLSMDANGAPRMSMSPVRSLLSYQDPTNTVSQNISKAFDDMGKFKLTYGITQDYRGTGGKSGVGLKDIGLYRALDSGKVFFDPNAGTYEFNSAVPGSMRSFGGKGFERQMSSIIGMDAALGNKVNMISSNGKFLPTDASGKVLKGARALVDTGETDANGNKIFTSTIKRDTKYNKVSLNNLYVQNKETGEFSYMGNAGMGYTHIKKKSGGFGGFIGGLVLSAAASYFGVPFLADKVIAPLLGISGNSLAATTIAAGLLGGAVNAATGQNPLTGVAMGALGNLAGSVLSDAANKAGGWGNLFDQVKAGNFDTLTTAIKNATTNFTGTVPSASSVIDEISAGVSDDAVKPVVDAAKLDALVQEEALPPLTNTNAAPGIDITSIQPGTSSTPGVSLLGDTALDQGINLTTGTTANAASNALASGIDDGLLAATVAAAPVVPTATGSSLLASGVTTPAIAETVAAPSAAATTPVEAIPTPALDAATGAAAAAAPTLSEQLAAAVQNPVVAAALAGGAAAVAPSIINAMNPQAPIQEESYGDVNPTPVQPAETPLYQPIQFNNLFARQGVGAGQYLGYDLLNNPNVAPPDVMSLLGQTAIPGV
jgi:hypothetical protein